jgi:RPA family protein
MTELPGNRETAYRVFAAEFDDATVDYQEGDEERAPNYVVTPTGARANRLFVVGVLTEIESVNEDVLRARIVDPTGAFVVYAGQYQPDEMAALERLDPPAFVAVTGKARTFQPEDSDRVFTSVRPESINTVDAETRDRWVVRTARHTVERVGTLAAAADTGAAQEDRWSELEDRGVPAPMASGVALALEHYGTTPAYLAGVHDLAVDAAEVVAGERDEVDAYDRSPSDTGDGTHTYADLAADLDDAPAPGSTPVAATESDTGSAATTETTSDATAARADAAATDDHGSEGEPEPAEEAPTTAEDATAAEPAAEDATAAEPAAEEPAVDDATAAEATAEEPSRDADADAGGDAADDDEGVGDFEPGSLGGESDATGDQMYEFDEEEREEIEAEFGTEFSSGNDVPDPEESDLDAPDPDDLSEADATVDADDGTETTDAAVAGDDGAAEATDADAAVDDAATAADATSEMDDASEADDAGDDDPEVDAADVDLDAFVMDAMRDLNEGDGVDRGVLLEHVSDETGADTDAVEDAVQDALMGGQCYEPDDGVLKPI